MDNFFENSEQTKPFELKNEILPTKTYRLLFVVSRTKSYMLHQAHDQVVADLSKQVHSIWEQADCCPVSMDPQDIKKLFKTEIWEIYSFLTREHHEKKTVKKRSHKKQQVPKRVRFPMVIVICFISQFVILKTNYVYQSLVLLAFFGSISILFLMLSCALPQYGVYWPLFNLIFYFMAPLPLLISKRTNDGVSGNNACRELALFFTTVIVISAFALPVTLANSKVIQWGACAFSMTGTFVAFFTILGFFTFFNDDGDYSTW